MVKHYEPKEEKEIQDTVRVLIAFHPKALIFLNSWQVSWLHFANAFPFFTDLNSGYVG